MVPRTERGATEKIYRVRQYLNGQMVYGSLTFEEMIGFMRAYELLIEVQRKFW